MNFEIRIVADNATDEEQVLLYSLADCNLNDTCCSISPMMKKGGFCMAYTEIED